MQPPAYTAKDVGNKNSNGGAPAANQGPPALYQAFTIGTSGIVSGAVVFQEIRQAHQDKSRRYKHSPQASHSEAETGLYAIGLCVELQIMDIGPGDRIDGHIHRHRTEQVPLPRGQPHHHCRIDFKGDGPMLKLLQRMP